MRALFVSVVAGALALACDSTDSNRSVNRPDSAADGAAEAGGRAGTGGSKGSGGSTPGSGGAEPDASRGGEPSSEAGPDSSLDSAVPDGKVPDAATPDAAVVLAPGIIANVPYTCDSPFKGVDFPEYFYLENWEDDALDQPGVTLSATQLSSSFAQSVVDSVDCDDGAVDDACANCEAIWGSGTIEATFDATALGSLPSHVGFVWTDGGAASTVTITGYDAADTLIYTQEVPGIGDGTVSTSFAEDRFFGIVAYQGVKRVVIVNSSGGVEIDHLQYGR